MPRPVLTTERLVLRPMTTEHLPLLADLDADPEVLRHILGRARTPEEVADFWGPICADTAADAHGLGWWVGFAGEEFVGWWDLSPWAIGADPEPGPVTRAEAGWRLARRWWRRGLASEGAVAVLDHGFRTVGLETVWAETMATNAGSRGVMRRLGMRHVATEVRAWDDPLPGAEQGEVVYEVSRPAWERRRPRR